jgi:class 3 adenylate cyclase/tetratricopeptide (TPR) repeat protein
MDPNDVTPDIQGYTPEHLADASFHSPTALEGERKNVTVLFCDIVNSTGLAERFGPEAMHELLEAFFRRAVTYVHATGGTLNQFLGDGFMALFGAPLASEDHARRAVSAAWSLLEATREQPLHVGGPDGPTLNVRIGLNTGLVVVGALGDNLRMDYTAIGNTTNVAARLQALAEPGTAYLSRSTLQASAGLARCTPLGDRPIKGKGQPVPVFRLEGVWPSVEIERQPAADEPPLVGRDTEMVTLQHLIHRLTDGTGDLVLVHGEPGIGKSRLVTEVRSRAEGSNVRWLEGYSPSFGATTGYEPFRQILRRSANIDEEATDEEAWGQLSALTKHLDPAGTDDVQPYLATLLGLKPPDPFREHSRTNDPRALGGQILRSVHRLLQELSEDTPTILVFEDVQWLDASSEEMIEHLLPLTTQVPLLLIVTAREDAGALGRLRAAAHGKGTDIALASLPAADSDRLLEVLAGDRTMGASRRALTIRRAGGNPFFLEEVARSFWESEEPDPDALIPYSVQGVIMARVDRLDDRAKEVVRVASIIGRRAPLRILAAVVSPGSDELRSILAHLQTLDLLRVAGQEPDIEVQFKHVLVQEAVSDSILTPRRRELHRLVAETIEQGYADRLDEFFGVLASHFMEAEDWERAQSYLFKAGDEAGRVAADAEALTNYERALDTYARVFGDRWDPVERAALDRKIGDALFRLGRHEQAIERLELALEALGNRYPASRSAVMRSVATEVLRQEVSRRRARAKKPTIEGPWNPAVEETYRTYRALAWMHYFIDPVRFTLDALLILSLSEQHGVPLGVVQGAAEYGLALDVLGRSKLAARYLARAVMEAEHLGDPTALGEAYLGRGVHNFVGGRISEASAGFADSTQAYKEAGDLRGWGIAAILDAWAIHLQGRFERSLTIADDALRIARQAAEPEIEAWALWERGRTLSLSGTLDEAAASCEAAIDLFREVPAPVDAIDAMSDLAYCRLRQERLDLALAILGEAENAAAKSGARGYKTTRLLGVSAATLVRAAEEAQGRQRSGLMRRARKASRAAIRNSKTVPLGRAQAHRALGTYRWLRGHRRGAIRSWTRSLSNAETMGMPHELASTELEMGRLLGDEDRLARAAATFDEIGAELDGDRARDALDAITP